MIGTLFQSHLDGEMCPNHAELPYLYYNLSRKEEKMET